mgnify:CR=1 FL=1
MVPPAVERQVEGKTGAAIMWLGVDNERQAARRQGPDRTGVRKAGPHDADVRQPDRGNIDRNAGNILIDPVNNVILIDHSRAFVTKQDLPWKFQRVDAELWRALAALTAEQLTAALGEWLDAGAIRAMIGRRDKMAAAVGKLVAKHGADATIIP